MLAQLDITALGTNPKTWLVAIGGLILSMIVGRFVQAFRNGEGIKGAACAVWLGTNQPKQPQNPFPPSQQPQPAQQGNDTMSKIVSVIALLALAAGLVGCSTIDPGADPLVVQTERTLTVAKPAFDSVLAVEYSAPEFWRTNAPGFYGFCEWLKQPQPITAMPGGKYSDAAMVPPTLPRASAMLWDLNAIKNDYKSGKVSGGALGAALATMQSTLNQAQAWLPVVTNKTSTAK